MAGQMHPADVPASHTTADVRVLFAMRLVRMFAYGMLGVDLVLYLSHLGFAPGRIGLLLSLTLLGDVIISLWLTTHADRWSRRGTLVIGALLMALGGAVMAASTSYIVLTIAATIGVISPSGTEVGPFHSIEQACLAHAVTDRERTRFFAWYNFAGYCASALGALAIGGLTAWALRHGWTSLTCERTVFWIYAGLGAVIGVLTLALSPAIEVVKADHPARGRRQFFGLHESRSLVFRISALFVLDSFGGGFVLQSFVAWWFEQKFGAGAAVLGTVFFGTNLLSGVSGLAAVPVARRIGLVNTMVWTHITSNILLMLVPLMPTLPLAIGALLTRHLLSQMDVPTRQSYVNALVAPSERTAANGVTSTAKLVGNGIGPSIAGRLFGAATASGLPFFAAGLLKIIYDLLLWRGFRHLKPPEER